MLNAPNPRNQFVTDLILEIEKWQRAGADIVLGGDLNERLGDTQNGIANLVTECGLVDPHASAHGIAGEPSTCSRGSKRFEHVLVSSAVLPFIRKCGTDPFHQILFTDHCGLFLDIDLKGLLGANWPKFWLPNPEASLRTRIHPKSTSRRHTNICQPTMFLPTLLRCLLRCSPPLEPFTLSQMLSSRRSTSLIVPSLRACC
jgi:hypothetical protein